MHSAQNPVKMFISTIKEFMDDMVEIFPEKKGKIKSKKLMLETMEGAAGKTIVHKYVKYVFPHLDKVIKKDHRFIVDPNNCPPILMDMDIHLLWDQAIPQTQEMVWKYVYLLNVLASGIVDSPPEIKHAVQLAWQNSYC
tara:strand:- start:11 stop:427 length:417 start_codon:yes stop_codon:yes gene_type:complete